MRIVMFTNTYTPHVGGVARSVAAFERCFRERNHDVMVVAPEFEGQSDSEEGVLRVPAIQNFNGSDFSLALLAPAELDERLEAFQPQIVHAHHPFLLGNDALRAAGLHEVPLIYTHHTLYERYTHYVPADSSLLRRFVIELATCYANLCDSVIAPSESIAELLKKRGVEVPVTVVPTGVDYPFFSEADGRRVRRENGIPEDAFVVGHAGRLAPEKNLSFLADAVIEFMRSHPDSWFVVAGAGPSENEIQNRFESAGLGQRLLMLGELDHKALRDVYAAMNVFAFSSRSETQGMVLAEAMGAGTPVVALDANGAREIADDGRNGRLIPEENTSAFAKGLSWVADLDSNDYRALRDAADETAREYSLERSADKALSAYSQALRSRPQTKQEHDLWFAIVERISAEWKILSGGARALGTAAIDEMLEGELLDDSEERRDLTN
jgi:glycosyltransferase involved in cell wall biosynthesis